MKLAKTSDRNNLLRLAVWLLICSMIGLSGSVAIAQTEKPLPAVIAFQAEPSRILDSNLGKALGIRAGFRYDPASEQLWKAKSVMGLVSLPEDLQPFLEMRAGAATPFHYYLEFELNNDQHARDLKAAWSRRMPDQEERDGTVFFYMPYEEGAYLAITKERRAIVASGSYEYDPRRFPTLTNSAGQLLKATEKKSAGVALDFKGAERFVRAAVEFGKENLPPQARAYLTLPEKLVAASGDLVLVPEPEAKVVIECVDRDAADEVLETIQGLIALAKFSLNGADPQSQMQKKFLDTVKSQADGRQVILSALIPTELLASFRAAAEEAQKMNDVKPFWQHTIITTCITGSRSIQVQTKAKS